jgi:hypothetical protein
VKTLTGLFLVAYGITVGLSNNEFRYRLPVLGLTAAFAGFALANRGTFWPLRREGRWRLPAVVSLVVGLLFALVSFDLLMPGLGKAVEARATELASRSAAPAERANALERVAELDEVYSAPLRHAAESWQAAGDLERAIEAGEGAIFREPGDYRARILLNRLYRLAGNERKAAEVANGVPPTFNAKMQGVAWASSEGNIPRSRVDVGRDDLGQITGFHIGERAGGDAPFNYRWSGSRASIRLGADSETARLIVRASALPRGDGEPLMVRWRVNGADLGEVAMDAAWKEYSFEIPQAARENGGEFVVELEADARRPLAEDPRELAVAIDSVEAIP